MKRSLILFLLATNAYGYNPATREQQVEQTALLNDIKTNTAGGGGGGGNNSVGSNGAAAPAYSTQLGFTLTGNLVPVSAANPLPISGSISATNPSVSATGSAVPAQATMVGGSDGTNLRSLKVSATGVLSTDGSATTQPVSASSLPLPTGASTAANQATGNASLGSIDGKLTTSGSGLLVDGSGVTQPVSATTLPLPTGASTAANQTTANSSLSSIDGKTPALVTGRVPVDGSGVTQPISASSLPLPTGAASSANQSTEIASLASLDGKLVPQSTDFGTATQGIRTAAILGNENGMLSYDTGASDVQTVRVTVATSDIVQTKDATINAVDTFFYDWSSDDPIDPGVPYVLGNVTGDAHALHIFNGNGSILEFLVNGTRKFLIPPGGFDTAIPVEIVNGDELSVATIDGTTLSTGSIVITTLE